MAERFVNGISVLLMAERFVTSRAVSSAVKLRFQYKWSYAIA